MLLMNTVECPHCQAVGKVLMPPGGVTMIGPCPECNQMIAIFCGRALALNTETMLNASIEEQREHVLSVLTSFLKRTIEEIFSGEPGNEPENRSWPNSEQIQAELNLLDNPQTFDGIFKSPPRT